MAITATTTSTGPRHYIWWFPGSPVRVHLDLCVIEGLQERLQNVGTGKAEHGLLFGRVLEGATEVLEFQPASGRSVPEMIADFAAERGKRLLVGYYRTESGEKLRLNEDDLVLFKTFFGKPYQVFLLMQPNGFAPPNATFFFSRGGQEISEFPFLEFPLDASLLATEERDRISRRQQATEQPLAGQHSLPPESAKALKGNRIIRKIVVGILAVAALYLIGAVLAALWINTPLLRERSSRAWSALWSTISKPQPAAQPSAPSPSPLRIGLQARRQNRDLELTWDRESPLIAAATSALISIQDGSVKREISLDSPQLRGESILYSPASDQVLIQLTVTGPTGAVMESVRVIGPKVVSVSSSSVAVPKVAVPKPSDASVTPQQSPSERIQITQPSKPFAVPPAVKNASSPAILNEPPALSSNVDHPASPAVSLDGPQTLAPPRPVPVQNVPPQVPTTAVFHPPVALTKVAPRFPAELKALTVKPVIVAIRVAIDKTGKVLKAEPLPEEKAHKLFIMEAVHAAQLWKFQPARLGDEPVASESVLQFAFSPDR